MKDRLIFIGGVHGVGKTQFARCLARHYGAQHVIASELIRTLKNLPPHKTVIDVEENQDLLIFALKTLDRTSDILLLDGHYCLLTQSNRIEEVPLRTFRQLAPAALVLISNSVEIIRHRLDTRDGSTLSESFVEEFQKSEITYAERVSEELAVSLNHFVAPSRVDIENPVVAALFRG